MQLGASADIFSDLPRHRHLLVIERKATESNRIENLALVNRCIHAIVYKTIARFALNVLCVQYTEKCYLV